MKRKKKKGNRLKTVRGKQREQFFADGGTPQQWVGGARTYDNKTKRRASKEACRKRNWQQEEQ